MSSSVSSAVSKTPRTSLRSDILPFVAFEVTSRAVALKEAGKDVIMLGVGEPSTPTPKRVRDKAIEALSSGGTIPYTSSRGLRVLRERIARYYAETHQVETPIERIVITSGSSIGFLLTFLTAFDDGDRVGVQVPGYPAYTNVLHSLGVTPVSIPAREETNFIVDLRIFEQQVDLHNLKGLIIANPSNPAGTVMPPSALKAVADFCRSRGLWLIVDEIYHRLVYEGRAASALEFSEEAIVISSFSKYYCMTGWRVGWIVLPEYAAQIVSRLNQNASISAPYVSQVAAVDAFEVADELETVKASYDENRRLLRDALQEMQIPCAPMDGGFFAYADFSRYTKDTNDFCERFLTEAGVAITPGCDFDPEQGKRFARLCYAVDKATIHEALLRLRKFISF